MMQVQEEPYENETVFFGAEHPIVSLVCDDFGPIDRMHGGLRIHGIPSDRSKHQ